MLNPYKITITLKNKGILIIESMANKNIRTLLQSDLETEEKWLRIGDYFIAKEEVLSFKIEGDKVLEREKHSGKKLSNNRKKIK